jgi:hypothetical protein
MGKTVHWVSKMLASQLLVCYCVSLKREGHFTLLPPWVVSQQLASTGYTMLWTFIASTCKMLELHDWEPNRLRAWLCSKENLPSSRVITSFWIESLSSWMGHIVGTKGLTTAYFCTIPSTQWFKSLRQNQCIWWSSDPLWNCTQNLE